MNPRNTSLNSTRSDTVVVTGLKAFACGMVALALTVGFSWTFVKSSSVARVGGGLPSTMLAGSTLPSHLG